ncbi:MAG: hypothetical protein OHK0046_11850 [Anaerolineae bacterium]
MLLPEESGQIPHQSERFVQSALNALSAHVAILDPQGIIIGINSAWCSFAQENDYPDTGYGLGTNYLAICDSAAKSNSHDAVVVAQGIRDVMQRRRSDFYLEYPCHSRREKRWFVMHVTRFEWEGTPRYIVAHQNVTELKMIQEELAESKKHIQAILDNVINGIITLNDWGLVESVNPAAARIFGYQMDEMYGQSLGQLLAEPYHSTHVRELLRYLESSTDHEMVGMRENGETFPIYLAISKVQLGERTIFTAIIQDVTERKRMEAEILDKQKLSIALEKEREMRDLKNRFITMMSHELRTPLASILLSSDMLKHYGEQAPADEKRLYLENISTQVGHLTEMIKDVQTLSRSDSSSSLFMPQLTDLVIYCRGIVDEFNLNHHKSHRLFFSAVHENMPTLLDHKLMRQVLTNILTNAIKYSGDGGDIRVVISNGSRNARIQVVDEGIGIPEEDLPHLFEPFHRGRNVENLAGTGLGLAIAKQAIELHGGSIGIESQQGIGTVVTILLPLVLE